ncbi:MAG: transposase [Acidobacteriota bacterium]|nr:transposase [Acidobacteriota bacterium]
MDQENQVLFDVAAIKDSVSVASRPEPEVIAVAQRRRFSMSFKRRVVRAADACKEPGEVGALLRREGLYSSHLCQWRKEVTAVEERALRPQPRGPKSDVLKAEERRMFGLEREVSRLRRKLERAEQIIEAQKKLCELLGLPTAEKERR